MKSFQGQRARAAFFVSLLFTLWALFSPPASVAEEGRLPIVYSRHYNITLFGFQKFHPFDSEKYGHVFDYLHDHLGLEKDQVYEPDMVTDEELFTVHTEEYLATLKKSKNVARIAEMGILGYIPNKILQKKVLNPMRYAAGGTVLAGRLALETGWAVNLSGGYHHAKSGSGGGFCFFSDVPLAAHALWAENPEMKVMVVDLDAHQGNGFEEVFGADPRVFIYDVYNGDNYPGDEAAKEFIDFDHPLEYGDGDREYLPLLRETLCRAIESADPDILFYNAGTDIYEEDPLGGLEVTGQGIVERDFLVFQCAGKNRVPIVMVLSGGYTKESALLVGRSLENLLKNREAWENPPD